MPTQRLYAYYFLLACAYVLVGLWDFFAWRWANQVRLEASHPHLWVPMLGALMLSVSPAIKSGKRGWVYICAVANVLAIAVLGRLLFASFGTSDLGSIVRELLQLVFGIVLLWFSVSKTKENT